MPKAWFFCGLPGASCRQASKKFCDFLAAAVPKRRKCGKNGFEGGFLRSYVRRLFFFGYQNRTIIKTSTAILIAGGAFLAYEIFSKARALGNLIVSPGSIIGMDFVGASPVISFDLIADNTSSSSLIINSFAGNVYSDGTLVGNVYNFSPVAIPGNSSVRVPVMVQLQMIGLVNDIIAAFQYGNTKKVITVEGYANVGTFQLPVNLNFTVGA